MEWRTVDNKTSTVRLTSVGLAQARPNERQATLQWKSTREPGAEMPEERETTNGIQQYGTLNVAMKMWRNNFQFLRGTATQLLLPPHTGYYSITFLDIAISMCSVEQQHRNKPVPNCITKRGNEAKHWVVPSACAQMPYHQNSHPISRCMLGNKTCSLKRWLKVQL